MSASLPLRILLVLALVLNGIGGAMAGALAALPAGFAASPVLSDADPLARADDCHGADMAGSVAHDPPTSSRSPDCHSGDARECTDTAECRQACMHAAAAVAYVPGASVIQAQASGLVPLLAVGHPAPALPSPIRPPIP